MTGISEENEAAIGLIIEEYKRLESHDKDHSLLTYIKDVSEERFEIVNNNEFLDKFLPKGGRYIAVAFSKYYIALRRAVDEIEGINREPKANNLEKEISEKSRQIKPDGSEVREGFRGYDAGEIPF